jgi:hypothetical protein
MPIESPRHFMLSQAIFRGQLGSCRKASSMVLSSACLVDRKEVPHREWNCPPMILARGVRSMSSSGCSTRPELPRTMRIETLESSTAASEDCQVDGGCTEGSAEGCQGPFDVSKALGIGACGTLNRIRNPGAGVGIQFAPPTAGGLHYTGDERGRGSLGAGRRPCANSLLGDGSLL